jgi:WD40 repeat protein
MHITCPQCHNTLTLTDGDTSDVICPSCGSSVRVPSGASTTAYVPGPRSVARFEVLTEIGAGAFGTVYKARDPQLDRVVALKVPRAGQAPDGEHLERFLREARSAAQLRHPAIVPIHEVGQHDGVPYLVSEFVQGVTLSDVLTAKRPGFRESAELIARLADALGYAHGQGVVHRDVKPSNVLLAEDGTAFLTDFGLAKRDTAESTMTVEGQVLGTPAYMSPEQARGEGHAVDGRADVYSLGVMFYQLLTGELPFRGNTRMLLHQVLHDEPRPPRKLNDLVPRDLETVCLKAMAKEPNRRYAAAGELGDDLRRWLKGEAVKARPEGSAARLLRWTRRNRTLAAASLLAAVGLLATAAVSVWFAVYQAQAASILARVNGDLTRSNQDKDRINGELAQSNTEKDQINTELAGETKKAQDNLKDAQRERDAALQALYLSQFNGARRAFDENQLPLVRELLGRWVPGGKDDKDLRGFEWHYLTRLCQTELRTILDGKVPTQVVAFSPKSNLVAAAVGFSGDGFVRNSPGQVKICDAVTRKEGVTFKQHKAPVLAVAFSPDGQRVASADSGGSVFVWEAETGKVVASRIIKGEPVRERQILAGVRGLAFAPDGARLALALEKKPGIRIWDLSEGEKDALVVKGIAGAVNGIAFSPDGKQLVSAGSDGSVRVWNAEDGTELHALKGHVEAVEDGPAPPDDPLGLTVPAPRKAGMRPVAVEAVAFSPDGKQIASGGDDNTVKVWDTETGKEVCAGRGHVAGVLSVAFTPDGKYVVSGSADGTIRLWGATTGKEVRTIRAHDSWVRDVAVSADGRLIASASSGEAGVKIWDAKDDPSCLTLWANRGPLLSVAFSPDSRRLAVVGVGGCLKMYHPATGQEVLSSAEEISWQGTWGRFPVVGVAYSRDGKKLATGYDTGHVRIRDAASGVVELEFKGHDGPVWDVAFSPNGKKLATTAGLGIAFENKAEVWDAATGRRLYTPKGHDPQYQISSVAWDPNGRWLATGSHDLTARLWNAETGELVRTLKGHTGAVRGVSFSPDGKRLATASYDQMVKLWDPLNGDLIATLKWHTNQVTSVAWSPDSKRLASASQDRTVHVWDAESGQELLALHGHTNRVTNVAFSPDGRYLASVDFDGVVKVWDSIPLTPELRKQRDALAAEVRVEHDAIALVRGLADKLPLKEDVFAVLRADDQTDEAVRRRALGLIEGYRENGNLLNERSWMVVVKPGAAAADYAKALRHAEAACRLLPDNGQSLNTLGVAQYRNAKYREAVDTLLRSDKLNAKRFDGSIPGDLAFLAMAYHRLGEKGEAEKARAQLRESMKTKRWANDAEALMLTKEAETLLNAPMDK